MIIIKSPYVKYFSNPFLEMIFVVIINYVSLQKNFKRGKTMCSKVSANGVPTDILRNWLTKEFAKTSYRR